MTRTIRSMVAACAAALAIGSCADGPTGPGKPVPGTLLVTWTSPNVDDGAAVLKVVLPGDLATDTATVARDGVELFQRRTADTLRIAVFGPLASGTLLTIDVADVRRVADIRASVVEVAREDDTLRETLGGYALSVARQ